MNIVDTSPPSYEPTAGREMTRFERMVSGVKYWLIAQRRKLPYLVWWDDEVDVIVTLSQDKLNPEKEPFKQLFYGTFYEAEKKFREMGISFDTGMGCGGRDWEWDYSLSGPISVRFKRRAKCPEKRRERPRPQLVTPTKPAA